MFHVRKNIVKTSLDIIGERFMKDVNGLLVVSDGNNFECLSRKVLKHRVYMG